MPSDKWLSTRKQVKFYVTEQEYAQLKAALNGRPVADMLRDAVQAYIRSAPVGSQDDRHAP